MEERRRYPRIRFRHKIGVVLSSGQVVKTWSCDISMGGVQLLSDYIADIGDTFELLFKVPAVSDTDDFSLRCQARVAYMVLDSDTSRYRIGFEIITFDGDGESHYRRFIDQLLRTRYTSG